MAVNHDCEDVFDFEKFDVKCGQENKLNGLMVRVQRERKKSFFTVSVFIVQTTGFGV